MPPAASARCRQILSEHLLARSYNVSFDSPGPRAPLPSPGASRSGAKSDVRHGTCPAPSGKEPGLRGDPPLECRTGGGDAGHPKTQEGTSTPSTFAKGFAIQRAKPAGKKTPGIRTRVRMSIHSAAMPGVFQPCFPRYRAKSIEIP